MWNGAKAGRAKPYAVGDDVSLRITQPSEKNDCPCEKDSKTWRVTPGIVKIFTEDEKWPKE
jgi:hypothetical protein